MKNITRRFVAIILCLFTAVSAMQMDAFAAGKTGTGMAEWALRAYNEGWKYVYGSEEVGAVDCSGLIRSYINGGGGALALLNASKESGNISSMPNVHGLGLWCDGHAGVYVGKNSKGTNMAVDARNSKVNVVYSTMDSRSWNPWVKWFKIKGVSYPTTGWENFNGERFYYHNGEFVTGIFTVDGVTYDFGKDGALIGEAKPTTTTTTTTTTTAATTTTTAKKTTTTAKKTTTTTKTTTATKAATTTTTAKNSLKEGMSGSEVTEIQKRLIALGYLDAKATGYFGKQTSAAVKAFQRMVSLTPDGIVGESTKEALFADDAPRMTTTTATKATTTTKTTAATTTTTTSTAATTTKTTASTDAKDTTNTSAVTTTTGASATTTTTTAPRNPIEEYLMINADTISTQYVELEFGTSGYAVKKLQIRLAELGYYDGTLDSYYGVFLRMAVSQFQFDVGLMDTGVADIETQAILFSDLAPEASTGITYGNEYSDDDYMMDEGDAEQVISESDVVAELKDSEGLSMYSTEADISAFTRRFGSGGALPTLGITAFSEPVMMVVYNGDCYELSEDLQGTIDDCVFF